MPPYVRVRRIGVVMTVIGLLASSPQAVAMGQPSPARAMTTQQLQAESNNAHVPLQRRIDDQLKLAPGGRQISTNEIAWNGGKVIMSFPLDGQRVAPASSVTATKLMSAATATPKKVTPSSIHGCPTVTFGADWFCLYADINWGGRRLQWSTSCTDQLSNYGFDDQTSSWVNGGALYIYVNDPSRQLWTENPHTTSSYVGDANNDRATWFTDTHSC
jgi:hypothetical protein